MKFRLVQEFFLVNTLRGRPFDFWGGVWLRSEKNILQTDFEGKEILARNYTWRKKSFHWKKYMSWPNAEKKILYRCMSGKKFFHQRSGEKKMLTQTKSPNSHPAPPPQLQKSNGLPPNLPKVPELCNLLFRAARFAIHFNCFLSHSAYITFRIIMPFRLSPHFRNVWFGWGCSGVTKQTNKQTRN